MRLCKSSTWDAVSINALPHSATVLTTCKPIKPLTPVAIVSNAVLVFCADWFVLFCWLSSFLRLFVRSSIAFFSSAVACLIVLARSANFCWLLTVSPAARAAAPCVANRRDCSCAASRVARATAAALAACCTCCWANCWDALATS